MNTNRTYTVKKIATLLNKNEETVRRWIREGSLRSEIHSKKEGHVVDEQSLKTFVQAHKIKCLDDGSLRKQAIDEAYRDIVAVALETLTQERDRLSQIISGMELLLNQLKEMEEG